VNTAQENTTLQAKEISRTKNEKRMVAGRKKREMNIGFPNRSIKRTFRVRKKLRNGHIDAKTRYSYLWLWYFSTHDNPVYNAEIFSQEQTSRL
jgi:hypothetical protein